MIGATRVNEALRVPASGMLTTSDLAGHPDFMLGAAMVSPSTRTITGPGGTADVEPRVMQVLVVLADAVGQVVTRDTLFQRCWGGVYVGDDSLNRAIMAVRKVAAGVADKSFEIETISRTGYRLSAATVGRVVPLTGAEDRPTFTRRELAGGILALVALGGTAGYSFFKSRPQRQFDVLLTSAEQALRSETADDQTARDLRRATLIRPDSAKAWGMFAFLRSLATVSADPTKSEPALRQAQEAARRALALDPKDPYALLAVFELQGSTLDWATRDQRLREIIAIDPKHDLAISELVLLTQAAGLNRESWTWNERAIALNPFSFDYLGKRALKLWIADRVPQADKVIDQVRALYPTNPWPWWVRFIIYAMTDRPRAAQAMLNTNPENLGAAATISLWRSALAALEQRSAATIGQARQACIDAAQSAGAFAVDTVMILSALGEVGTAFDVANGFLLSRGAVVANGGGVAKDDLNDATWRVNTQYLFTPPCKILRSDRRFLQLCEGMGLTEYWRRRGVRPDYQLGED